MVLMGWLCSRGGGRRERGRMRGRKGRRRLREGLGMERGKDKVIQEYLRF